MGPRFLRRGALRGNVVLDYWRQHANREDLPTYGPRMHPNDGRVVSNFIVQGLLGRDITVYGEGLQTRSFCYVDDLIDGLVRLMATPADITGPVNIGNPTEFKIIELAQLTLDLIGSRSRIVRRPLPENDPQQRQADMSLGRPNAAANRVPGGKAASASSLSAHLVTRGLRRGSEER